MRHLAAGLEFTLGTQPVALVRGKIFEFSSAGISKIKGPCHLVTDTTSAFARERSEEANSDGSNFSRSGLQGSRGRNELRETKTLRMATCVSAGLTRTMTAAGPTKA